MRFVSRGKIFVFGALAVLLLAFAGCGSDDSSTTDGSSTPAESSISTDLSKKPKITVPDGAPPKGLEVEEVVEGDGAEAKSGDKVSVQYVGVGYKSGEEFDSSWSRGAEPFTFTLGAGEVIPGWDQGVEGMKEGGRRELIIPAELAYGAAGAPPAIGPNETLIFVVDLVKVG
jgi:peptidylprolyl isomerase